MYYLRLEPQDRVIQEIKKSDSSVIPERKYITDDRAIYKHVKFNRFYRQSFRGFNNRIESELKLYICKTLKRINELKKDIFDYCGEWFDIYDENGKVE